jgi:hypothetical protein
MLLAAGLLSLTGCFDLSSGCANSIISRADAPDGLHSAVMFQRDCGATTGFSTQISVLKPEQEPSDGGNAFIADADHGAAATGEWGGPWAEIRWLDNTTLLIRFASGSRIFEQSKQVSGVRINYQAVGR